MKTAYICRIGMVVVSVGWSAMLAGQDFRSRGDRGSESRSDRGETRGGWGDRGSSDRGGWSGRGGSGGTPGGGGFDPSAFLDRLDRNGNGMLDMDEREGPAGFIISRLQREDPKFNVDRPIPLQEIRDAFQRMREGRSSDSSSGQRADSAGGNGTRSAEAVQPQPLVPGFGEQRDVSPLPSFGSSAILFDVRVTDEDRRQAAELLRRYDRDKDGFIGTDEISSRWEGNPMDFDRNRDGRLSLEELAIRAARRREAAASDQAPSRDQDRRTRDRGRDRGRPSESVDPYDGARSFLNLGLVAPEVPAAFREKDSDGDGQIAMREWTSEWTEEKVREFYSLDHNRDGVITLDEFRIGPLSGDDRGSSLRYTATAPESQRGDSSRYGSGSGRATKSANSSAASGGAANESEDQVEKYRVYAERTIKRYDTNKDGVLDQSEWKKMFVDPSGADYDKDGKITVEEYVKYLIEKANK